MVYPLVGLVPGVPLVQVKVTLSLVFAPVVIRADVAARLVGDAAGVVTVTAVVAAELPAAFEA
jgi:hypothetical protein